MELETVQLLKDSALVATIIISMVLIVWLAFVLTKNDKMKVQIKKLKTWRKFAGIEARQLRSDMKQLQTELTEELEFSETQDRMYVNALLKVADLQELNEKLRFENTSLRTDLKAREDEYAQLKEHYAGTMRRLDVAEKLVKVDKTEISELKAKLSRKNLKRDAKGRVLPKVEPERDWTQASKDELLAEAKRRGFVRGAFHTGLTCGNYKITQDLYFIGMDLYGGKKGCIFDGDDGQWAQIITE